MALQSFPAMGEWMSFTATIPSSENKSSPVRAVATAVGSAPIPACFLNAGQLRDFACHIWRKQK